MVQRMRLNDARQENGELEVVLNGQSKINVSRLVLRSTKLDASVACRYRRSSAVRFISGYRTQLNRPFY